MSKFILIGGIEPNTPYANIAREILSDDNKKLNMLFIPLASKDSVSQKEILEDTFKTANTDYLYLTKTLDKETILNKINNSDILFFLGGSTPYMYKYIVLNSLEYIFEEVLKQNKTIVGISAGAIILSKYGMGDTLSFKDVSTYYNFKEIKGLGILNINFCPHYQKQGLDVFDSELKNYKCAAFALDNGTAIVVNQDKIKVVKNDDKNKVYFFDHTKNYKLVPLENNKTYDIGGLYDKNWNSRA